MTHAAVWLDSAEARVFRFTAEDVEKKRIKADRPQRIVHPRARPIESDKPRDNREFFEAILAELTEVDDWMIVGPADARQDFEKYVRVGHAEELAKKLVGVEAMDQPTDAELLDHARRRLRATAA